MIEFIQNEHFNHLFHNFKKFLRKKVEKYTQEIVIFSKNLGKKHHKKYPVSGTSEYRIRIPHIRPDPDIRSIPSLVLPKPTLIMQSLGYVDSNGTNKY